MEAQLKNCNCNTHVGANPISVELFGRNKNFSDGLQPVCKSCRSAANKKSFEKNPDKKKEYYLQNKQRINIANNKRYQETKDYRKILYHENKDKYLAAQARSRKNRKENGRANEAEKNRKATDVNYRLSQAGRDRRRHALKAQSANSAIRFIESLGCSISEYKKYLESKFQTGMTWANYGFGNGRWQIDEIRPCASFDLTDPEQYKQCFHYTNTQPLWACDNLKKGSLYNGVRYIKRAA